MAIGRKAKFVRLLALALAVCLLLPGQAALAAEETPDGTAETTAAVEPLPDGDTAAPVEPLPDEGTDAPVEPLPDEGTDAPAEAPVEEPPEGDAAPRSIMSDYAFYIAPPEAEAFNITDPKYRQDFFLDSTLEETDGTWSYEYDKNNTEFPFTLTLKEGFRHSFAIFNNTDGPEGKPFRIVVEGSAVFTEWLADSEGFGGDVDDLCAAWPVYVSGGKLTIESFAGVVGGYLTCPLLAEEGAHIDLPNGVLLNTGSLWAQGGTVTVENGRGAEAAVTGYNGDQLFCYVDDRWPAGKIIIDGQGKPAAEFRFNGKYAMDIENFDPAAECITGLEVENIKLTGRKGERLQLGSKSPYALSIYSTTDPDAEGPESVLIHKELAEYVEITNSTEALEGKNAELKITFKGANGELSVETARTGLMMALPEFSMSTPKGKKFKCWSIDGVEVDTSKDPRWYRWMFPADTTVEAVFVDAKPVEVYFNANGGEVNGSWRDTVDGKLEFPLPYPYREGYDFIGWYTEQAGGQELTPDTEFWGESYVTVYAHWRERTGDGGAFYGTELTWTLRDGTLTLAGSGAVPEMSYLAPWESLSEQSPAITAASIGPGVTQIPDQLFSRCYGLERITVDGGNPYYSGEGGVLYSKDKTRLLYCPAGLQAEFFTVPAGVAWANTRSLVLSKNLKRIDAAPGNSAYFSQDGVLYARGDQGNTLCAYPQQREASSYTVPSGTAEIGEYAFYGSQLAEISLPDSVTVVGPYAFNSCDKLERISLPAGVTELEALTFFGCENLREVRLPGNLQSIGNHAFRYCRSLREIQLPESLRSIGQYAFNGCTALREASLPEGLDTLEYGVFSNCTSLARVQIPSTLRDASRGVFSGCTALEGIVIPDGVNPVYMLDGCPNLKYAVLGKDARRIDAIFGGSAPSLTTLVVPQYASMDDREKFGECFPKLEQLYYCGSKSQWDSRTSGWAIPDSVQVHTDSWFSPLAAEDLGGTTRVYLYNNLIKQGDYLYYYLYSASFLLAAYDGNGRMLCIQSREAVPENGLIAFTLPVPLSRCERIAAFAVQPVPAPDTPGFKHPDYAPLASPSQLPL